MLSIIAAVGRNNEIGKDNQLPWRIPAEMKLFKRMTSGDVVVMGRRTAESLGKPLPNRINVVMTRGGTRVPSGFVIAHDVETVLSLSREYSVWVIGGEQIYRLYLPLAHRVYLSHIDGSYPEADRFFPVEQMEALGFHRTLTIHESIGGPTGTNFRQTLYKRDTRG